MRCPLCSGPVEAADGVFECEIGHRVDGDHMALSAEIELAESLWMAIQALDNEAEVLRMVGGERGAQFADDAERQSRQLRTFARQQARRVDGEPGPPG